MAESENDEQDDNQLNEAFVDKDNSHESLEKTKKQFSFNVNLAESNDFNEQGILSTEMNHLDDQMQCKNINLRYPRLT
jgi:hypothetical protein